MKEERWMPKNTLERIVFLTCIGMSIFHLYSAGAGAYTAMIQRSIHLAFALFIGFLIYPTQKNGGWKGWTGINMFLATLAASSSLYIIYIFPDLIDKAGAPNFLDLVCSAILSILILEIARRALGLILPVISIIFLIYAYAGPIVPGVLSHRGIDIERILSHMYLTTEGIFGVPIAVSAKYIFLFILFGAFLQGSGAGKFFIDLAFAVAGKTRGGPAKVAVLASALFGTLSGSSVANVVSTGAFTIPLMKRTGYKDYFAGAVESAASTGGQIMPPVMGATAFVMAEVTGISYFTIVIAAIIPAILYFLSVGIMIHLEAVKLGLKGLPKEETPNLMGVLKQGIHHLVPIIVLIYLLLIPRFTPIKCAFWAIISLIVMSYIRGSKHRLGLISILNILAKGAKGAIDVAIACASAGFIVGVITLTGLGLKFSIILISLSHDSLFLALTLTMAGCIVLGMGVNSVAAYLMIATVAGPGLIKLGIDQLSAHLFMFYYGCMAPITPPVALAAYAGAGIAGSPPMKTAFYSCRLAIVGFIIPFMFVYGPSLLMIGSSTTIILSALTAIVGVISLSCALQGQIIQKANLPERFLLFFAGLSLIKPGIFTDLGGAISFTAAISYHLIRTRKGQNN